LALGTLVIVGCNGSSTIAPQATVTASPTSSASPSANPSPSPSANPSSSPSAAAFTFHGTTATANLTSAGGPLSIGAYQGVTLSAVFSSNNATAPFSMIGTFASNSAGDITPTGFPAYTGTAHVVMYLNLINSSSSIPVFTQTPAMTWSVVSPATLGTTGCSFYTLSGRGSGTPTWQAAVGPVTPVNGSVTFPTQTLSGQTLNIGSGTGGDYTFLGCQ